MSDLSSNLGVSGDTVSLMEFDSGNYTPPFVRKTYTFAELRDTFGTDGIIPALLDEIERLRAAGETPAGDLEELREIIESRCLPGDHTLAQKLTHALDCRDIWSARLNALAQAAKEEPNGGYRDAFYEIAGLLGMPAMPVSPKEAFETVMLPTLKRLLAVETPGLIDRIETLAANNITGCGTCSTIIDEIRRSEKASGIDVSHEPTGDPHPLDVHEGPSHYYDDETGKTYPRVTSPRNGCPNVGCTITGPHTHEIDGPYQSVNGDVGQP